MKKNSFVLMVILLCIICADSQSAEAYSVTVEKDGMYAEVVPDSFVNNTGTIFKKYVKKAMKYYNKYKDVDDYTYVSKVPQEYRDFIPVAKQIQDSDEIVIKHPFYLYYVGEGDDTMGDVAEEVYDYCFFAEKNGEKLCMFHINIDSGSGEVYFEYNKMEDGYFTYDEKSVGETLFYEMDNIFYAETPDQTSVVWDKTESSWAPTYEMIGGDDIDWEARQEAANQKFEKKSYHEKKEEILTFLGKTKKGKSYKKAEKNLKLELEDEYIEPEEDTKERDRAGIYIVTGIGVIVIGVVIIGLIYMKKRKTT